MTGYTICRDCKFIDLLDGASNIGADNFIPYSLRSEFQMASSLGEYYGDHIPWSDLRNFSFVERFHKENVSYYANKLADELADDIQEEKDRQEKRKEDYPNEEVFKSGNQGAWIYNIMEFSVGILGPMDQINAFFNGGNISFSKLDYRYTYMPGPAQIIVDLSTFKRNLDEFVQNLQMFYPLSQRVLDFNGSYQKEVLAEAECFYDNISSNNSTVEQTFSELVPKEMYMDYVERFYNAIINAVKNFDKSTQFVQREYDFFWNSLFTDLDINKLTTNFYGSFLEFRKIALNVDIDALALKINEIINMFGLAAWKTYKGEWPEMERFVDNLLRKTLGSEDFWLEIDDLYQMGINVWEEEYYKRQKDLAFTIEHKIKPFMKELLNILENLPENESVLDKKIGFGTYLRYLPSYFDQKNALSRMNEDICWILKEQKLVDFQTLKSFYGNGDAIKMFNEICFSNWPAGEEYPKSFDDFFEKIHALLLTMTNDIIGPCQYMMG